MCTSSSILCWMHAADCVTLVIQLIRDFICHFTQLILSIRDMKTPDDKIIVIIIIHAHISLHMGNNNDINAVFEMVF